jgi:hypothetical protein
VAWLPAKSPSQDVAGFQSRDSDMTRTTIALTAALLMGTATVALAGEGSRPAKRASSAAMQSTPMRATQPSNMSTPNGNLMMNVMDRASSPFSCGV